MKKIKVIFLGYLWPLIKVLHSLERVSLVGVGLEPNRISSDATWVLCKDAGIQTFDASKIHSSASMENLLKGGVDIVVIGAFGQILDKKILCSPVHGVLNFHPSLLPSYRGGSPIEEMLIRGDKEGGVTLHWVSEEVDEGSIVSNARIRITSLDDYATLLEKGLQQGVSLLKDLFAIDIKNWPSQDRLAEPTFFPPRKEVDGVVDWNADASQIVRICNALGWRDWVRFPLERGQIIIRKSRVVTDNYPSEPGTVIANYPKIIIRCGINSLELIDFVLPRDLILGEIVTKNK
tara:strand:+ start:5844 stop:6716 length:873 start_codon:yes stop_codon:yes gene_type:complete